MKLAKFNPMPEEWTPEQWEAEKEKPVLTITSLNCIQMNLVLAAWEDGHKTRGRDLLIQHGVQKIEKLETVDGKIIATGDELLAGFKDSDSQAAWVLREIAGKILDKSKLPEITAKNS